MAEKKKKKTKKPTQVLASDRAARTFEEEAVRMISGGEMPQPAQAEFVQEDVVGTPRGLPRGIAGTEVITDSTGKETLVYRTEEGQAKVPVQFGVPSPIGGSSSEGGKEGNGQGDNAVSYTASDGTKFSDRDTYLEYEATLRGQREKRQSAFDLLYEQFSQYGLGSLVEPLKNLIKDSTVSPSEFTVRLRETDAYKKRFAANQARIAKGLRALDEGSYLELEDSYQNIMRRYGLPQSYYTRGDLGRQEGFEKFIEADVSPVELEERISTAQNRIYNAPPEVMRLMSDFYGNVISNGDALAYILDPKNALSEIQRKVTAAEIGAGAAQAGLTAGGLAPTDVAGQRARAEELAAFGVTGEEARRGFQTVAEVSPRGGQLAEFYGESPYTQKTAEAEVFGTAGAVEARKKRERLVGREQASFAGSSGAFQGALSRDRQGAF